MESKKYLCGKSAFLPPDEKATHFTARVPSSAKKVNTATRLASTNASRTKPPPGSALECAYRAGQERMPARSPSRRRAAQEPSRTPSAKSRPLSRVRHSLAVRVQRLWPASLPWERLGDAARIAANRLGVIPDARAAPPHRISVKKREERLWGRVLRTRKLSPVHVGATLSPAVRRR